MKAALIKQNSWRVQCALAPAVPFQTAGLAPQSHVGDADERPAAMVRATHLRVQDEGAGMQRPSAVCRRNAPPYRNASSIPCACGSKPPHAPAMHGAASSRLDGGTRLQLSPHIVVVVRAHWQVLEGAVAVDDCDPERLRPAASDLHAQRKRWRGGVATGARWRAGSPPFRAEES